MHLNDERDGSGERERWNLQEKGHGRFLRRKEGMR